MKQLPMVATVLVVVGAINWGLVGLSALVGGAANWNIVNLLLGSTAPALENLVYVLIGIAGVWFVYDLTSKGKK